MNVLDAAHRIAHEYPGGAKALAARMGINQVVFNSKLNPNVTTHHLMLAEAMTMQHMTGRNDILHAMAEDLNHVAIPLPVASDDDLAHSISTCCAEFGDYLRRVDEVIRDGKVTPNERKDLERELTEMIAAATHLQGLVASMHKKGPRG